MRYSSRLLLPVLITCLVASHDSAAQVLLSDSFTRTVGTPAVIDDIPPMFGESDWGMNDNAAGGTVTDTYTVFTATDPNTMESTEQFPEIVDGSVALINSGRVIYPYNFGADASVLAADAISFQFDINPADTGSGSAHGRDWGGLLLSDTTNSAVLGSQLAISNVNNVDVPFGIAPRNSGSIVTRLSPTNRLLDGKPDPNITEAVFDQTTFDAYVDWYNGGDGSDPGDPVLEFPSDVWYTVKLTVSKPVGGELFDSGATHGFTLEIGPQGGPLSLIDLDPATPSVEDTLVWGDNEQTTGNANNPPGDPTPGVKDAHLVLIGNGPNHQFDNLLVELVSGAEPAAGDFNGDGRVDNGDLNLLLGSWGNSTVPPEWVNGFVSPVDNGELNALLGNWGFGAAAAVPEPASLVLCGLLLTAAASRRRA